MLGSFFVKILTDLLSYVGPLALDPIVAYVTDIAYGTTKEDPLPGFVSTSDMFKNGFFLIGVIFVATILQTACYQTFEYWAIVEGIHVRSAIQTTVYEKSLRLSTYATSGGLMTMGQITNHMSTDAMNLFSMFMWINTLLTTPIQVILTLFLLYLQMGTAAILGACVFIFVIPVQIFVGSAMSNLEKQTLEYSDQRLKDSNEVLQGIKLLKLYGWEDLFCKAIEKVRNLELWTMFKINSLYGFTGFLTEATPLMVTLISFGTYTLIENKDLTPDVAFSSLALFNLLGAPLFLFPITLFLFVNGYISTSRLQIFLAAPDVEGCTRGKKWVPERDDVAHVERADNEEHADDETYANAMLLASNKQRSYGAIEDSAESEPSLNSLSSPLAEHLAIKITGGNFTWDSGSTLPVLSDINMEIPAGKLTMIVGSVGSGKSSLVSAILGEMTTLDGSVRFSSSRNSIAYAGQKAWLVNASLKDNILFGQTLNNRRYKKVLDACALKQDIDILPGGDRTEIGEKGINLSGGQKQRVSVARAVYSAKDIVILDDPLSALDVHVGAHVFQQALVGMLLKKKVTVILVTHQLQFLQQADQILVMKNGKIAHEGTFDDIQETEPELYSGFKQALAAVTESDTDTEREAEMETKRERMALQRQISKQKIEEEGRLKRQESLDDDQSRLIQEEEMERGSVKLSVYLYYLKSLGWPCVPLIVFYLICPAFTVATNFWLSAWSEAGLHNVSDPKPLSYYIGGYAGLSVAGILTTFLSVMFLVVGIFYASRTLHLSMLRNVIKAPMRFFDTTPLGRILNRFSADTQTIDMKLIMTIDGLVFFILGCIAALVVNVIVSPWFLLVIAPVSVLYYFLQKLFITCSRELQRLDSVTKSPIFSFFSETLGGLPTIRAYGDQQRFYDNIMDRVTTNNTAYLYLQTMNRWLGIRLDSLGALIVLLSALTTVITSVLGEISPSDVGLAISYALSVSVFLNLVVRFLADTEMQMNAVERVKYYTSLPTEPSQGIEPPPYWPQKGEIQAQNISVRYAQELDPVIKNVNINIPAGQKVGICGRTGSGKSSLTLALFRIIDTYEGHILIDGENISQVPLTTLRRRLAIIPQDPVLFNGTVRYNLDPDQEKTDQELWDSIEIAQLKDVVTQLEGALDASVSEGGENFSVGQRQLFCLARAFLRKSRILIMDEATASIDQRTDQILQKVVATAFGDRTVLTIAHRVATILDSDSIIVLSDGTIVEHDTPENLLADENSLFSSLVRSDE
ncbi:ATP-binding cassette sub-family C member 9-like isoform X2 [Amphiura filiformis]|uniref:ATP-binding cassette sub-family C member 9-like isoform X2 n=1 Tax=Amphiura filiformis TaxID=82378 RepID=UPI003B20BDC9